ncbi:hypothetical protein [Sphingomonas sp. ID0503]|uniref:hypothetical protein n=1 Tax=Sphingomonas sp. ID0503 TaxID=3399691 RepID=UPI003AFA7E0F
MTGNRMVGEDPGKMSQNGKMSDDPKDGRRVPEGGAGKEPPQSAQHQEDEQGAERLAELGQKGAGA